MNSIHLLPKRRNQSPRPTHQTPAVTAVNIISPTIQTPAVAGVKLLSPSPFMERGMGGEVPNTQYSPQSGAVVRE